MEKRKRRLSDIGKQFRVKVQRQEINHDVESCRELENLTNDGDILAVSPMNKTRQNLSSNDIDGGQEPLLFTKAVTQVVKKNKLSESSTSSVVNNSDDKRINKSDQSEDGMTNNTRVFLRDDSGYQSEDLLESPFSSDSEECFRPEKSGQVDNKTGNGLFPSEQFLDSETKEIRSLDSKQGFFGNSDTRSLIGDDIRVFKSDKITEADLVFDVDESDEIIPCECTDIISDKRPDSVDKRWARSSLGSYIGEQLWKCGTLKRRTSLPDKLRRTRSVEPDQHSNIYIPHEEAENPVGDEFGAEVWTYRTVQKDGTVYHQHYFTNVKHNGPAAKMKIRDDDEIVLLNTTFVPNFTHNDILNLFHHVKVDGKTRFKLVLRRLGKVRSKKEWEWIDTSAVLVPDCPKDFDKYPEVKKPKLKKLKSNEYAVKSVHYYNVPGTQRYLDIEDNAVVAKVFTKTDADKTKIICRIDQYKFNTETEKIDFTAALYSEAMSKYIVVGTDKQIKLDDDPMWFDIATKSSKIRFKINGMFLACNKETLHIETHAKEYMFEEEPIKKGIDHPDHAMLMNTFDSYNKVTCINDISSVSSGSPVSLACGNDRKRKMNADEFKTNGNDPDCAKHASKSVAMETDMTLDITKTTLVYERRSAGIPKTPTTPFRLMSV